MRAGFEQRRRRGRAVAIPAKFAPRPVANQQVKTVVDLTVLRNPLQVVERRVFGGRLAQQPVADQRAARRRIGAHFMGRAVIRQRRKTAVARHAKPRAAAHQIAPGQQVRRFGPPVHGIGGAAKEFVAIGGECEKRAVGRIGPPVEDDQAHRGLSPAVE